VSNDGPIEDENIHPLGGVKQELYVQRPGHDVRTTTLENGACEIIELVEGYQEKVAEVHRLWSTTHKNRPLSIAVRLGLNASEVRRILDLPEAEECGFDNDCWDPTDGV
jgi:hypothetical protein